jgi:phosphoribosylamine--glycine ligase
MLQEKVDGIEMGIAGWFGPHGWSALKEESFEHKKFMNDDLGCNTGEMGTVIQHVKASRLFDKVLKPLTGKLHELRYVGDCNVNCMIDAEGEPWPFEFTMRLGWPDFTIRCAVMEGDPIAWMRALLDGKDEFKASGEVAVGVVLAHGDFPTEKEPRRKWVGFPINGLEPEAVDSFHPQQIMADKQLVSAGCYLAVVTGAGKTVREAKGRAYGVAWQVEMPSNLMFRTDIGERLRADLPKLHKLGYAEGMDY